MADKRAQGVMSVAVDGGVINSKGNFELIPSSFKREGIAGHNKKVHGFKKETQIAEISGDITVDGDTDIKALLDLEDATITVTLMNGKVFVLTKAWNASEHKLSTDEGTMPIKFQGEFGDFI